MKIFREAMDQCLLCIDYAFRWDAPISREAAEDSHQPGVRQKKWWNYLHQRLGLEVLTAYEGPRPVGQIEFIPIEYAPRPIRGEDLHIITCLHVPQEYQGRGIGSALLAEAEERIRLSRSGVALIANPIGEFMPIGFFLRRGFQPIQDRDDQLLMYKPFQPVSPPAWIPFKSMGVERRTPGMDYFHCPQCPRSGWALSRLEGKRMRGELPEFDLRVTEIKDRQAVLTYGTAHQVLLNGAPIEGYPYPPDVARYERALRESMHDEAA